MKKIYVVTAPSGYWEKVASSREGAQNYIDIHFPQNWDHGHQIKVWEAFPAEPQHSEEEATL